MRDSDQRDTAIRKPMGSADSSGGELPFENHYTVAQLGKKWNLGRESIRKLVMFEPGVLKLKMGKKKAHIHYLIPESVAMRIYTRLKNAS